MIDPIDPNIVRYREGLYAFTTPKGIRTLVLRLQADPSHTPDWIANARRLAQTEKQWRREMEGDWSTPEGDSFFPIFTDVGRDRYVHMATKLIRGPVYRSYDTGRRRPAVTFFQYSPKQDRIWLMREFMPHDLQAHEFRECVRYLSGQCDISELNPRSQRWIELYKSRITGAHCPPPWFPPGTEFVDIGGNEVRQGYAAAINPEEATFQQIMAAKGIHLIVVDPDVKGRNMVVDRMLMVGEDGWPRTFIDPQCEEMISGFSGEFTYAKPTLENQVPDRPRDDGHLINLLDAYGYGVSAVVPKEHPVVKGKKVYVGDIDREPRYVDPSAQEEVGWSETRRRIRP